MGWGTCSSVAGGLQGVQQLPALLAALDCSWLKYLSGGSSEGRMKAEEGGDLSSQCMENVGEGAQGSALGRLKRGWSHGRGLE